jgi:hypothetical protein
MIITGGIYAFSQKKHYLYYPLSFFIRRLHESGDYIGKAKTGK